MLAPLSIPGLDFLLIKDNWLQEARLVESPNCSARPPATIIDLLVIHNISLPPGEFGTGCVDELFCNRLDSKAHPFFEEISDLRVSAHLLIDRNGEVTQYVPFDCQAWHAGQSEFQGRQRCNEFSIGIELEGTDHEVFTPRQYDRLGSVSRALMQSYPAITADRIVGHSDIAPGRKTDPGPCFDWDYYLGQLKAKA
jgi:AmpD protein